jgi:hypothetical protein
VPLGHDGRATSLIEEAARGSRQVRKSQGFVRDKYLASYEGDRLTRSAVLLAGEESDRWGLIPLVSARRCVVDHKLQVMGKGEPGSSLVTVLGLSLVVGCSAREPSSQSPLMLAAGQARPSGIAVDPSGVYWLNAGETTTTNGKAPGLNVNGQVMKCSIGGRPQGPNVLAGGLMQSSEITLPAATELDRRGLERFGEHARRGEQLRHSSGDEPLGLRLDIDKRRPDVDPAELHGYMDFGRLERGGNQSGRRRQHGNHRDVF